ncbi:MAG: zinc-dependent metalloprotease [Saprospiraceae bacterium]|nr:zinc-dependent metalloprotease [Saprospiraceae bacterium]
MSKKVRGEVYPNGSEAWIGRLEDQDFGYAVFAQTEGVFWGKIQTDAGEVFLLKPQPETDHYQLLQIDAGSAGDENCEKITPKTPFNGLPEQDQSSQRIVGVCDAGATCSALTLDILVVYSPSARTALGGSDAAAQSAIAMAVAELNTICANSNVTHNYALAHAAMVTYTESGSFSTDLDRLENASDGILDEVYDLRDYYYADLVSMVLNTGGCGLGNVNVDPNNFYSHSAFSCVDDVCLTSNLSLSHELGHNVGFRHDRYAYSSTPSNVCSYAWGWVNPEGFAGGATSAERWRTVMAYNSECSDAGFNCTRIPYYSNPTVTYNGDPTGSAIGNSDEAYNAYLLNRSACLVDAFRVPVICGSGCTFYQGSANYNTNTSSGPGNTTDVVITESFIPLTGGSGSLDVCVYYRGDHSGGTETFNVKDENGNTLGQTIASNDCVIPTRVCFSVNEATYNNWITDGSITISLDPTSTAINPTLCSGYNRVSVELLVNQGALPVEFTRFEIIPQDFQLLLEWETATEINNDHFLIEHSRTGSDFQTIGKVGSLGDATLSQTYRYPFQNPEAGIHYFRIRQVDQDGTFNLTDVRSIRIEAPESAQFQVFPNPSDEVFFIRSNTKTDWQKFRVELFDFAGKQISVATQISDGNITLQAGDWPNGLYFVRISDAETGKVLDGISVVKR